MKKAHLNVDVEMVTESQMEENALVRIFITNIEHF